MTRLAPTSTPAPHPTTDAHARSLMLAAEVVLAHLYPRAPLRLVGVSLAEGVTYACAPDPHAMRLNRGLTEDVVMVALAAQVAGRLMGVAVQGDSVRQPADLLGSALTDPEEQEVQAAYLAVLKARAQARLRKSWAEVEVVAAGLRERGELDAREVAHRIACAQGIRSTLLN